MSVQGQTAKYRSEHLSYEIAPIADVERMVPGARLAASARKRTAINQASTFSGTEAYSAMSEPRQRWTIPRVGVELCCVTRPGGPGRLGCPLPIGAVPGVGIRHLASWLVKTCRMSGRENGRLLQ